MSSHALLPSLPAGLPRSHDRERCTDVPGPETKFSVSCCSTAARVNATWRQSATSADSFRPMRGEM